MRTTIDNPTTVPATNGRYSHIARIDFDSGALLILSGQVAVDYDGNLVGPDDMAAQSRYVMEIIRELLKAHGADMSDVVNIRTFVTDLDRLPEYGAVRHEYFPGVKPTSTTVEVSRLFVSGALLEVEVTATTSAR